jgi:WD40 repeat protein
VRFQKNVAKACELAAQSTRLQQEAPSALDDSIFLAAESIELVPTYEGDQAIRAALRLARHRLLSIDHADIVNGITFSPDSQLVATFSGDRTVKIYHVFAKKVDTLQHDSPVLAIAFSLDSHKLATASLDKTVRIFGLTEAGAHQDAQFTLDDTPVTLAFSADGSLLAVATTGSGLRLFNAISFQRIEHSFPRVGVPTLAFSTQTSLLAVASDDGITRLLDARTGRPSTSLKQDAKPVRIFLGAHDECVITVSRNGRVNTFDVAHKTQFSIAIPPDFTDIDLSENGQRFAIAGSDGTIHIVDPHTGQELKRISSGLPISHIKLSPDGQLVAITSNDKAARLFDATTAEELARFTHREAVSAIAFSRDGSLVGTASLDHTAQVFELADPRIILSQDEPTKPLAAALSSNGQRLAFGGFRPDARGSHSVQIIDLNDSNAHTFLGPDTTSIRTLQFFSDAHSLATGGYDGISRVFDADAGETMHSFPQPANVLSIAASKDGRFLVAGTGVVPEAKSPESNNFVYLYELKHESRDDMPLKRLKLNSSDVIAVAINTDPTIIATASLDRTVVLHDWNQNANIDEYHFSQPPLALRFSPDGRLLAIGSAENTVRVYNWREKKLLFTLLHGGAVTSLVFSLDGRILVTGSEDQKIRVFEVATGKLIQQVNTRQAIWIVALASDDRAIENLSWNNGTLRVERDLVSSPEIVKEACGYLADKLKLIEVEHRDLSTTLCQ